MIGIYFSVSLKKKWADFKKRDKQFWTRITRLQSEYWSQEIVLKTERRALLDFAKFQLLAVERF